MDSRTSASNINSSLPTSPCRPPRDPPCIRCQLLPPRFCCDKHSPHLIDLFSSPAPLKNGRQASRSCIKSYTPGQMEEALGRALQEWRDKKALDWLGPEHVDFHGGFVVMTDGVLADIVKYASKGKLSSVDSLRTEARWSLAQRFGVEVLQIINDLIPPSTRVSGRQTGRRSGGGSQSVLADSSGIFINLSSESVSWCCKVDCLISIQCPRLRSFFVARGGHAISF